MATLRASISNIQVIKGYILFDVHVFVYVTLRNGHVILGLKILLRSVGI
jgi:hypothetical protein